MLFRLKADYEVKVGLGKLIVGYQYRQQQQDGEFSYLENREVIHL
jgi:hypothetical protein